MSPTIDPRVQAWAKHSRRAMVLLALVVPALLALVMGVLYDVTHGPTPWVDDLLIGTFLLGTALSTLGFLYGLATALRFDRPA